MPAIPSMGVLSHFGTADDTSATPTAATTEYEFLTCGLGLQQEHVRTEGLRGTRLHPVERVRLGRRTPGGSVSMQPTYAEMVTLLPKIISANATGVFTVSDTVPVAFQAMVDKIAKVATYTGCRTSKANFHAGVGQPLTLDWDIEALEESIANAGSFASLTISPTAPFVFTDGVLTIGSGYQIMQASVALDWHLKMDRFVNSLTRTDLPSMDFSCQVQFTVPYTSDTVALYNSGGSVAGSAASLVFTYGSVSLTLSLANVLFPAARSPIVQSRDEITLQLTGEARKSGSTSPLIATLDSTP